MIKGIHTMFYTSKAMDMRAFIRDKLQFPHNDVGGGWLIFDLPEAEMGCHPAMDHPGKQAGTHEVSFYCDDIEATVAELKDRGVTFLGDIKELEYGYVTSFEMPGDVKADLYQPFYKKE